MLIKKRSAINGINKRKYKRQESGLKVCKKSIIRFGFNRPLQAHNSSVSVNERNG